MSVDFRADQIRVNKIIASGSTGNNSKLLIYPVSASSNLTGDIDLTKFKTGSIGTDIFMFVSGAVGCLDSAFPGASVFGGDVHVSGNLRIGGALLNVTASVIPLTIVDFATTQQGLHTSVGQIIFNAARYSGSMDLELILATTNAAQSASAKLYNLTNGGYVHIGGPSVTTITTTNLTPTIYHSINLRNATNFTTSSGDTIYELQLALATGSAETAMIGGASFRVSASMINSVFSYISAINVVSSSVATTGSVPTLLQSITLSPGLVYNVDATILAKQTANNNRGRWIKNLLAYHSGGFALIQNDTVYSVVADAVSTGSLGINFEVSGSDLRLFVTGSTATVVSWSANTELMPL